MTVTRIWVGDSSERRITGLFRGGLTAAVIRRLAETLDQHEISDGARITFDRVQEDGRFVVVDRRVT